MIAQKKKIHARIAQLAVEERAATKAAAKGIIPKAQYDDLLEKWKKVEYVPMRFTREAVDAAQAHRLVLEPG